MWPRHLDRTWLPALDQSYPSLTGLKARAECGPASDAWLADKDVLSILLRSRNIQIAFQVGRPDARYSHESVLQRLSTPYEGIVRDGPDCKFCWWPVIT